MVSIFPTRAIAFTLGPIAVHWYGILYLVGFLVGFWILKKILKYRNLDLTQQQLDELLVTVFIGVIVGGRLGFALFYEPMFFLAHPLQILAVWNGGMSSHGGFIAVALGLIFYCRKHGINLWQLGDVVVIPVAIGLMLGRLGNLINGELYGTVTTVPWAMSFPGVDGLRHPTQIYAMLKDLFIASACFIHLKSTAKHFIAGRTGALFLMLYGTLRFIVEIFREQPYGFIDLGFASISWGQAYTLPIIVFGAALWLSREGNIDKNKK